MMTILIIQLFECNANETINTIMITKDKEVLTPVSSAFMFAEALVAHAQE